nr:hypothetical protein [uncultured Cohaesibacter sp.]
MTALYIPPPVQTRTQSPSQLLRYFTGQALRAVGTAIGTVSIILTMIAFFGAGS